VGEKKWREKNGFYVIGASRQQQERGRLVETEAKTEAGGVETETEAVACKFCLELE